MTTTQHLSRQRRRLHMERSQAPLGRVYHARLIVRLESAELVLEVPVRPKHKPHERYMSLIRHAPSSGIDRTWLECEVLKAHDAKGILLRLVRRGLSGTRLKDISEFIFQIPVQPMVLEPAYMQHLIDHSILANAVEPKTFFELLKTVRTCTVLLGGNPILLRKVLYRGQVHVVGSSASGVWDESEVTDSNPV